ncbi:HYR domain-containing protein, partial [Geojedonia litorea]
MKKNLLLIALLFFFHCLFAQTEIWKEDFDSYTTPTNQGQGLPTITTWKADGAVGNNGVTVINGKLRAANTNSSHNTWQISNSMPFDPIEISGYSNVSIYIDFTSSGASGSSITTEYSLNGVNYFPFDTPTISGDFSGTKTASKTGLVGANLWFRIIFNVTGNGTNKIYFADNIKVTGTPAPLLSATILAPFDDICTSFTSGANSFVINGSNLTAPVTVAALSGYTYSLDNTNYYTALTGVNSIPASEVMAGKTVYVKFSPTSTGPNNGNIVISSNGATAINVAASGSGISTPVNASGSFPSNTATNVCSDGGGAITALGWQAVPDATLYDVYFGTTNTPALFQSNLTTLFTTQNLNLLANTTYYWKVVPKNNCGIATVSSNWSFTTATTPCNDDYCDIIFTNVSPITKVIFEDIYNESDMSSPHVAYQDFKSQSTTVAQSSTHSLIVEANTGKTGNVDQRTLYIIAFFDWNQDNDFLDAGESIEIGTIFESTGFDGKSASKPITIPSGLSLGNIVMRVIASRYDYNINPCVPVQDGNNPNTFGQTEDYTVNICALPVAKAQNVTLYLDASGTASLTAAAVDNGSTANCGLQSLVISKETFTCADLGINTGIFLTVTDNLGNTNAAEVIVTVVDTLAPTLSQNTGFVDFESNCAISVPDVTIYATDNCSTVFTQSPIAGTSIIASENDTIGVTIFDQAGNDIVFTLTVKDETAPVLSQNASNIDFVQNCQVEIPDLTGFATDNCTTVFTQSPSAGALQSASENDIIEVLIYDNAGNSSVYTLTVQDVTIPVISTNGDQNLNAENGECGAVFIATASATDNCSVGNPTGLRSDALSLTDPYPVGITTISWNVNDINSNPANQVVQTIIVTDNQAPVAVCPQNITVATDANQCGAVVNFTPNLTDNCTGGSVLASPASGSFFNVGTTQVTVTATDAAGNTDVCNFDVTVNDTEDPVVSCPSDITVNNDAGQCGAIVNFAPTATDNCSVVSIVSSPASGSFFAVGTTQVTVTATDAAGNTDV